LLRIDATDIDKKVIKVFSQETTVGHPATTDVVVADAVAASIAVPLIFSPKVVDAGRLRDGDLVSNLPMWLLD
jgi:NTE family protein